jgi:DNA polymerase
LILFADTETFSSVPIKEGVHAYSDADDAEIMLITYARDDGEVHCIDLTAGENAGDFYDAVRDAEIVVFHNSAFDRTMLRKCGQLVIPCEKIHDTMVNARAHGLPGALGVLCEIFRLPSDQQKDKRGKQLIQMFCKPQPKNQKLRRKTRDSHPIEWEQFKDYAKSDIPSMRALYYKLPRWNFFDNPKEHALWCLDQKINDRGFGVDLDLIEGAERAVADEKARLKDRAQEVTEYDPDTGVGVESATKRDQLLRYALEEMGVSLPDLRAGTIERRLDDPDVPEPLKELLRIRLMAASASSAKYKRASKVMSAARIRGSMSFSGAARTGRWSGSLFQPQNLPRPDMKAEEIEQFIEALKGGYEELISDNIMKGLANSLRGLIVPGEGKKLVVSDLSNIEGRVLSWLANEEWKLDAFRAYDAGEGPDLYYVTAAAVTGKPLHLLTKLDRQNSGKVPELACGYQGAVGAFQRMAQLFGLNLSDKEVIRIVTDWRKANWNIVSFWGDLEEAFREACANPGKTVLCRKVRFLKQGAWLRVIMPGGTSLSYASPKVDSDGKLSYMGLNNYTRQWESIPTYGGKLAENITQHVARCVMAEALPAIEAAGYEITLLVHDEVVCEAPDLLEFNEKNLSSLLVKKPAWPDIEALPLSAAGFEGYRYRKE